MNGSRIKGYHLWRSSWSQPVLNWNYCKLQPSYYGREAGYTSILWRKVYRRSEPIAPSADGGACLRELLDQLDMAAGPRLDVVEPWILVSNHEPGMEPLV
jgi:hypothetical protein